MLIFILCFFTHSTELPKDLVWHTNTEAEWTSDQAKKGGTQLRRTKAFPLTLRRVGPDSNGHFAAVIRSLNPSLLHIHPNTKNHYPYMAKSWAFHPDGKTVFYRLDERAKWSDGKPVTADDYVFTLEMMRSPHILAPFYNAYYTEKIVSVRKWGPYLISVGAPQPMSPRLLLDQLSFAPQPVHYYKTMEKDFVKKYNWKIPPNAGPYFISKVKKGKSVTLKRVKNWWGESKRFLRYRYNMDRIRYVVVRNEEVAFQHFLKGKIHSFLITDPMWWYDKAKGKAFHKGWIHKIWFYTDAPAPNYGIFLNTKFPLFQDINVRKGVLYALHVDKVLKTLLRGDYERLHTGDTGMGPYTPKELRARTYDLVKSKEFFAKSGWKKRGSDGILVKEGMRMSFPLSFGASHHTNRMLILVEEAKKAGVEIRLDQKDRAGHFKFIQGKKHAATYSAWAGKYVPQYWSQWHSKNASDPNSNSLTGIADPTMDVLVEKFRRSTSEEERIRLSHTIQEKIKDLAVYHPLWLVPYFRDAYWRFYRFPVPVATKTSDEMLDPFLGGYWWDEALYKETMKKKSFPPVTLIDKTFRSSSP